MLKRIITSICAVCVLVPVLWFSDTFLLPLGIAAVSLIATYELAKCMGLHKRIALVLPAYLFAAISPFLVRYLHTFVEYAMIAFIVACLYLLLVFFLVIRSHGKLMFSDALTFFAVWVYMLAALNAILYIHDDYSNGRFLYLLIFMGAWITDIFAYFCGMIFGRSGKHKLIPDVSPKKTVEGSIGGIVFCVLVMWLYGLLCTKFTQHDSYLWFFAIGGLIASVVAQIGDLLMSVIKRNYGIKDYGRIFPGHGGMLDRLDSVLAVSVALVAFSSFFEFFKGI